MVSLRQKLCFGILLLLVVSAEHSALAHGGDRPDSVNTGKLWIGGGLLYAGSMYGLDALWYRDFPRSRFHTFDDWPQWLQMDKVGHATTAYHINDASSRALMGMGISRKRAGLTAAGVSFMYLTGIEVLDGFSAEWGFSWGDQAANTLGIAAFLSQDLVWQTQRIRLKYSYWPSEYAAYNPSLLGRDWTERWLKDYNGQTYWLSINPAAFMQKEARFPRWLNVAVGYGAKGMLSGRAEDQESQFAQQGIVFEREREFYLSLDIDLTRIETRHRVLRIFLDAFGFIKIPAPGFQWTPGGSLRGCLVCGA